MTLIAIWYRETERDLYAIADSRLTSKHGTLTDSAPKFSILNVTCYAKGRRNIHDKQVLNAKLAIGYAGSSSVAFSTISTLQGYCSSLALKQGGSTPSIADIAELAKRILDENFRQFGAFWGEEAKCDLLIFGALEVDKSLRSFQIHTSTEDNSTSTNVTELPIVKDGLGYAFGSASDHFKSTLDENMRDTGNFHPFNTLKEIIENNDRKDVGGRIQVAIAKKCTAKLPGVLTQRLDVGEFATDVSFLGRNSDAIGLVGDCEVGIEAVGLDLPTILENRKKAGY